MREAHQEDAENKEEPFDPSCDVEDDVDRESQLPKDTQLEQLGEFFVLRSEESMTTS